MDSEERKEQFDEVRNSLESIIEEAEGVIEESKTLLEYMDFAYGQEDAQWMMEQGITNIVNGNDRIDWEVTNADPILNQIVNGEEE